MCKTYLLNIIFHVNALLKLDDQIILMQKHEKFCLIKFNN